MSASLNGSLARSDERAFHIRFPGATGKLDQDEEWFEFDLDGRTQRLRIHDYADTYRVPGLYEALVYGKLRCNSPRRMAELLASVLSDWPEDPTGLRVLDLGAGNGIVAQELKTLGVESIVGLDLLPEAALAARRDRPGVYCDYIVSDLCDLSASDEARLRRHSLNCLVTVAALGFGDVPPEGFLTALNLIDERGWIAVSIKEDFLAAGDDSGFARLVRRMIADRFVEVESYHRYCHRISINGEKLFYVGIIARKLRQIPQRLARGLEQRDEVPVRGDETDPLAALVGG